MEIITNAILVVMGLALVVLLIVSLIKCLR